jgi:hypothetical protein
MARISIVSIAKFKRFEDLTVSGLDDGVKIVVLAGPNGRGKSSLFDAYWRWRRDRFAGGPLFPGYYERVYDATSLSLEGSNGPRMNASLTSDLLAATSRIRP